MFFVFRMTRMFFVGERERENWRECYPTLRKKREGWGTEVDAARIGAKRGSPSAKD
jgi:hypothetical protein